MTLRTFTIDITQTIELVVDDSVVSQHYEGETVLSAHENRERFTAGTTQDHALIVLAVALNQRNAISRIDGWADFPDEAARVGYFDDHDYHNATITETT